MTLVYLDGFDNGDFASRWTYTNSGLAITAATDTPFAVGKCLHRGQQSGTGNNSLVKRSLPAMATFICGFWFRASSFQAATTIVAQVYGDTGSVIHTILAFDGTTGLFKLCRGTVATVLATATDALVAGNWYWVEWKATIADSGGIGIVKVNSVTEINFSGDTKNAGTATNIDAIQLFGTSGTNTGYDIDDLYICNALGSANNDFLGQQRIQTLNPNAAGNDSGLTPTGSVNHYANVTDQNTATWNASSVATTRDTYALPDVVAGTGVVAGIQTVMAAQNSDAGAGSMKAVVRSGGTNYYDTTQVLTGSIVFSYGVRETDPATSAAWTASGVNALQVGAEVV